MAVIEHAFLPELPRNQFEIKFNFIIRPQTIKALENKKHMKEFAC